MLVAHMLNTAGHRAAAVGNTEVPFAAALDGDFDVFAVECSSFRLNWLYSFRAEAAAWLNFAPDHQNWHTSMDAYEAAKARIWEHRRVDRRRDRFRRRPDRDAQSARGWRNHTYLRRSRR